MGILDDTAIFVAIMQHGGFSHAAKHLGLSNGLVSRRIAQLETRLGVTLIKRTTRQLQLTSEGKLFWQHAQKIQQELDTAIGLIHAHSKKPKGKIRLSAPLYFGRHYLMPIIMQFLTNFNDIEIELQLSNQRLDPIKEHLDLVIRGAGYLDEATLKDSSMHMKLLITEKVGLYASPHYLSQHGEPRSPDELVKHTIIHYNDNTRAPDSDRWDYRVHDKNHDILLKSKFNCNDIESSLYACINDYGIGKFTELNAQQAVQKQQLKPILTQYDWGDYHLYALYSQQQALPKRTRLLLEFLSAQHYLIGNSVS